MALLLVATPSNAAEERSRLIKTVFYSETGEKAEFNAVEGGAIRIAQIDKNIEYRLIPEFVGEQVQFKLYDVASGALLDTFAMSQNGRAVRSAVVPFSLSVQSIEEHAEQTPSPEQLRSGEMPTPLGWVCCVTCGRYRLCCEPAPGKCCTVSSSCGYGCRVCN
ncbi:hypothetical protein POL68_01580 [Stigmatella sp. ncwal1]|uniref:Uncharacterized protein n=1 Tax=Stigmatella ashevillensis TaxID=2995309 RepID=A0ABT5D0F3_9BACT|nr:hypothetical protein [Stigmatella ashevillena]MDC0707149.1 hypothetical protein [Stigmatella ashevillena]